MPAKNWDDFSDIVPNEWNSPLWKSVTADIPTSVIETDDPLVEWNGKPVLHSKILDTAQKFKTTPGAIMRLGTPVGRFESRLAKTLPGQALMRTQQGFQDLATATLDLTTRTGLTPFINREKLQRRNQESAAFQDFIERGGDVESVLGKTGSRLFNSIVRSTGKMAAAGMAGAVALYSAVGAESFDNSLNEAEQKGLKGTAALSYAGKNAALELGVTFLMGRAMERLGVNTFEESLTRGAQREAARFRIKSGISDKLKPLIGAAGEFTEESTVEALQQYVKYKEGFLKHFDFAQILEAGTVGALSAGTVSSIQAITDAMGTAKPEIESRAAAVVDSQDTLDGLTHDEAQDLLDGDDAQLRDSIGKPKADEHYLDTIRNLLRDRVNEDVEARDIAREMTGNYTADISPAGDVLPETASEAQQFASFVVDTASPALFNLSPIVTPFADINVIGRATARHADLARSAELLGLDGYSSPAVKTRAEMQSEARKLGIPERAVEIAQDYMKTKNPLKPVEQEGLKIRFAAQEQHITDIANRLAETTDTTDISTLGAEMNRNLSEAQMIHDALAGVGTQYGQGLVFRKFEVQNAFTPVSLLARATASKKAVLTDQERTEILNISRSYQNTKTKLDKAETSVRGKRVLKILKKLNEESETPGGDSLADLYSAAEQLMKGGCDF